MANQKISQLTNGNPPQAADQIPINRAGANFSITAGNLSASVTTAFQGALILPNWGGMTTNAGVLSGGANAVAACMSVVSYSVTIANVGFVISTGGAAGALIDIGIYNAAGTTLLVHTGAQVATAAASFYVAISGGGTVQLTPGVYWIAATSSDATVQMENFGTSRASDALNAGATKVCGIATNTSALGVLPATLGGIATPSQINMPIAAFQR